MGIRKVLKKTFAKVEGFAQKLTPQRFSLVTRGLYGAGTLEKGFHLGRALSPGAPANVSSAFIHRERTRTGGALNTSFGDEEVPPVEEPYVPPPEEVDEEAARRARRRSRARQRGGRQSTILSGGGSLGGGSEDLG